MSYRFLKDLLPYDLVNLVLEYLIDIKECKFNVIRNKVMLMQHISQDEIPKIEIKNIHYNICENIPFDNYDVITNDNVIKNINHVIIYSHRERKTKKNIDRYLRYNINAIINLTYDELSRTIKSIYSLNIDTEKDFKNYNNRWHRNGRTLRCRCRWLIKKLNLK